MPRLLSKEEMDDTWEFCENGTLLWKKNYHKSLVGKVAGTINNAGYAVLSYDGSQYKIHRLIYAYHTGDWPLLLDHINRNRSDNRFDNLRPVTHQVNTANVTKNHGRIKFRGVSMLHGKYRSFVQSKGVREFLGYFATAEEASAAYEKRRSELNPGVIKT